jgi:hypothetical protein
VIFKTRACCFKRWHVVAMRQKKYAGLPKPILKCFEALKKISICTARLNLSALARWA